MMRVTRHALVVICSTTGNGDAPENASRFVRRIKRPPPPAVVVDAPDASPSSSSHPSTLSNVAYAVLALGDTNYDRYCETGKVVDRRLCEWGGRRAIELTCADEATGGLEDVVEPWLEEVAERMGKACLVRADDDEDDDDNDDDTDNDEDVEGLCFQRMHAHHRRRAEAVLALQPCDGGGE